MLSASIGPIAIFPFWRGGWCPRIHFPNQAGGIKLTNSEHLPQTINRASVEPLLDIPMFDNLRRFGPTPTSISLHRLAPPCIDFQHMED